MNRVGYYLLYFLFYFILFYFILFYFILFYFILFYFILFYFILFYFILFYFILFYFILFYFILFYFILFYFIYFILFYFILFYFTLFSHSSQQPATIKKIKITITKNKNYSTLNCGGNGTTFLFFPTNTITPCETYQWMVTVTFLNGASSSITLCEVQLLSPPAGLYINIYIFID